jgi:hypothetical protein
MPVGCAHAKEESGRSQSSLDSAAEHARTALAKTVRRLVRRVFEIVLNDIDLAAAFGDSNRAGAFEEKHLRGVPSSRAARLARLCSKRGQTETAVTLNLALYKGAQTRRASGPLKASTPPSRPEWVHENQA